MLERAPLPGPYALEGGLDLATAALEPAVDEAIAAIARVHGSQLLADARARASGELRYYVDDLQLRLTALADVLGARLEPTQPEPDADYDDDGTRHEVRLVKGRAPGMGRERRTIAASPHRGRPPASRDALIAAIAEALLIERALPTLLDADAHAVTLVLSRVGPSTSARGLLVVASTLARPGWFDEAAVAPPSGDAQAIADRAALMPQIHPSARDVAIVLRGLFVRAALDGEHGTWMVRSAAAEPDMIRVELRAGGGAVATLRAHLAARRELERVLEHGGALPANPDALLPVTRTLTYRMPLRPGEPFAVEMEDFSTGWVDRGSYRDIDTVIRRAWHLAWSRRGRDATREPSS